MRHEPNTGHRVDVASSGAAPAREGASGIDRNPGEEVHFLSERHARDLIETIPAIAWSTLADGSNIFVSERWTEYTGLSAEDTAGWGWRAAVHPDDIDRHADKWRASLASGEPFEDEARFRRAADGEYRWFLARAEPLRDEQGNVLKWYGMLTDIEDRKQAEQAQRESEEQWRAIFESSPTMNFTVDEAGAILLVNAFGARQLGYDVGELVGQPVLNVFLESDRELVQKNAERCFQHIGEMVQWQARKVRKDGTVLWVRETGRAIRLKNRPVLLVVCEDITERKRVADELRESERRFRMLVQFSFDAYWESDENHRFTRQEFGEGLMDAPPPGSEIGKTRWEIPYLEPDEDAWRKHRATLDAHLPFRDFELARPTPEGGKRYVSVSGMPVFDESGRFVGYRGVGRHITERKVAEAELRRREKELRDLIEAIPAISWTILSDGSNVFASRRWTEYSGLPAEAMSGSRWLEAIHPDDLDGHIAKWRVSVETGVPFENEARLRRATDGEYRWFLVRAVPLHDDDGKVVQWYGLATDIDDRKRAEAERAGLEERLRQAEKMEAMGRFASGIVHDFSNILGGILAYGEMLFDDAPESSPRQRYAQNVLTAATRGRDLVDQILAYTRSQRGKHRPTDVCRAVAETLEFLRGSLPASITLHATVPDAPLVVMGDGTQLHQIVTNLCSNAVHAMKAGGPLRVAVAPLDVGAERVLSHGTLKAGRHARLSVEDSGCGMDEATLVRIFEPFFTTKEIGRGTGLGLALVYAIVAGFGGVIDVKSVPDKGSAFSIYLPIADIPNTVAAA